MLSHYTTGPRLLGRSSRPSLEHNHCSTFESVTTPYVLDKSQEVAAVAIVRYDSARAGPPAGGRGLVNEAHPISLFETMCTTRALRRPRPDPVPEELLFQNEGWRAKLVGERANRCSTSTRLG